MIICLSLILVVWMIARYGININIKKDTTHREIYPELPPVKPLEDYEEATEDPVIAMGQAFDTVSKELNKALFGGVDDETNS